MSKIWLWKCRWSRWKFIFRPSQGMVCYLQCCSGKYIILEENLMQFSHPPLFWSSHYTFANSSQLQTDFEFIGKVLPFVVFLSLTCEAALECVVKWVQYRTQSWPWNFLPRMFLMIFFFFWLLFPLIPMLISLMIMVSVWWNDVSWMVFVLGI